MNRRQFLSTMAAVPALGPLSPAHAAIDPIKRSGNARMKLSLAAYSFRDALAGPKKSMTLDGFVDLASTYDLRRGRADVGTTFPTRRRPSIAARCAGTPS